jgi:hypothetical protein
MKTSTAFSCIKHSLVLSAMLTCVLFFSQSPNVYSQQSANGTVNPCAHIATKLNVTAYPLGTFQRAHTMDVMHNILTGLQQVIGSGNATTTQKLKFQFCKSILSDVSNEYIATEITLLTSLSALNSQHSTVGNQQSILATMYNNVVAQLQ